MNFCTLSYPQKHNTWYTFHSGDELYYTVNTCYIKFYEIHINSACMGWLVPAFFGCLHVQVVFLPTSLLWSLQNEILCPNKICGHYKQQNLELFSPTRGDIFLHLYLSKWYFHSQDDCYVVCTICCQHALFSKCKAKQFLFSVQGHLLVVQCVDG